MEENYIKSKSFKLKKIIGMMIIAALMMGMATGCSGKGTAKCDDKKIVVNLSTGMLKLKNVDYYDFFNEEYLTGQSDTYYPDSNSLNSCEITYLDNDNILRAMRTNKKFKDKPDTIRVYKDSKKKTYDEYGIKY